MSRYVEQLFSLEGRTAILTGAGGFLIGEMARALGAAGVNVVVGDLRLEKAEQVAGEIVGAGGRATPLAMDVREASAYEAARDLALREYGRLDAAILGAGINAPTPFLEIPIAEWNDILAVQLTGTMIGCQVLGAHLIGQRSGSIITISSASAGPPLSKAFTYSVAKAGILNLTKNLAREWAPMGVRVNALRPGFFPTEWSMKHFITPEREAAILGHTAMRRYGRPEELVGAVIWLLSDAASFVTGAEIAVDGGFSAMTI